MQPNNFTRRHGIGTHFFGVSSEQGGSVVVAAIGLPLLMMFLLVTFDLGRVIFFAAEVNNAAHAVRCLVEAQSDSVFRSDDLNREALLASPSLGGEGLTLEVAAIIEEVEHQKYGHQLYDNEQQTIFERSSQVSSRSLEVTVEIRGHYLTPIGALIAQVGGYEDALFTCKARVRGSIDETIGGGVW